MPQVYSDVALCIVYYGKGDMSVYQGTLVEMIDKAFDDKDKYRNNTSLELHIYTWHPRELRWMRYYKQA